MLGHGRSERRWQEENLDEYEEEVDEEEEERYAEEGDEEEEEEEEEEAEEEQKPTAEELEYLTMRERMKAKARLKLQKENAALLGRSGASGDHRRTLQNAEFGSFFGPSKPAIARRVIEERHSLQETQHMRAKETNSSNIEKGGHAAMNGEKREHISSNGHAKNNARVDNLKAVKEIRSKAQALKDMRDYSFLLSDDADVPAPAREPPPRKPSIPLTDARPTQAPQKTKAEVNRHAAAASESRGLKKPASVSQKIPPPKVVPQKPPLISKPNPSLSVPKNISSGTVANGPSRLQNGKSGPASSHQNMMVRKSSATSMNKPASLDRKPMVSGSSSQTQNLERRKEVQVLSRERPVAKQSMPSSRPQQHISSTKPKPLPQPQPQPQTRRLPQPQPRRLPQQSVSSSKTKLPAPQKKSQLLVSKTKPSKPIAQQRPSLKPLKRKPISRYSDDEDEGGAAISMIRRMFGYDPKKYAGDDEDDSDMEANFDDIQMEELRSSKIGQREDDEQLRLIEEEERRERMRKMAKKRKLG